MPLYPLPPTSDFVTTGETKATFKAALSSLRAFLNSMLGQTGNQVDALTALGAPLNGTLAKTAGYTVVAADRGKLIDCTGTFTLAVDDIANLGNSFTFIVRNNGSGLITINPYLSQTIDGAASIAIIAGESALITMNDSASGFVSLVRNGTGVQAATAAQDGYMTSVYAAKLDGIAAGATVGVSRDVGANGLGDFALNQPGLGLAGVGSNGTISGGSLAYPSSGTWRNVCNFTSSSADIGGGTGTIAIFQRIA